MKTSMRILFIAALVGQAGIAAADDTAEAASKHARAAMKAGRIHEACQAYEESDRLAPKVETELSLASCYEQDGKPVSAARLYRSTAEKDDNAARRQTSIAKASKLEAGAPKLRFAINPNPPGLVIKVDGVEVPTTGDVLVDTGPHEVLASAPGYSGHASAPVDRDHVTLDVILRMEQVEAPMHESEPAPPAHSAEPAHVPAPEAAAKMASEPAPEGEMAVVAGPTQSGGHRKRNAVILGAGGVALAAGAVVLFSMSSSKFDDEHALCPMSTCATPDDLSKAKSLVSDGRTMRGIGIGMGIGGIALLGASAYLLLTPGKHESPVALQVEPGHAGITYSASF